jgi:hypothetical protein
LAVDTITFTNATHGSPCGPRIGTKIMRPRVNTPVLVKTTVLMDKSQVLVYDRTTAKRKIIAAAMKEIMHTQRANAKVCPDTNVSDLLPTRKAKAMYVKAINKRHPFVYRDPKPTELGDEVCFNTTPMNKPVDLDAEFRKRQAESAKQYQKSMNRKAQSEDQADSLQVA